MAQTAYQPPLCGECEEEQSTVYCDKCTTLFCDTCRNLLKLHRREDPAHKMVSVSDHFYTEHLEGLLSPDEDNTSRSMEFTKESGALWFSVTPNENGGLDFLDHARYAQAIDEHRQSLPSTPDSDCYPVLASFTGDSGAGKSAIIRFLMEHPWDRDNRVRDNQQLQDLLVPVIGIRESTVPTSADVHLYCDPIPHDKRRPLLFADCEGFRAGEADPMARRQTTEQPPSSPKIPYSHLLNPLELKPLLNQLELRPLLNQLELSKGKLKPRELTRGLVNFARTVRSLKLAAQSGRHVAVSTLYPKLLYNMADVLVHVIDAAAARSLEEAIVNMLVWAQSSQKAAVNRSIHPHLIIVLNRSTTDCDWDPDVKTEKVFKEQIKSLGSNKALKEEQQRLATLGTTVNTLEELLGFSYASVKFIKLPPGPPNTDLLVTQLEKLHHMIQNASALTQNRKADAQIRLSSTEQESFFDALFDHYSDRPDEPFDFVKILISLHPLPSIMATNFYILMRSVKELYIDTELFSSQAAFANRSLSAKDKAAAFIDTATPSISSAIALHLFRVSSYPGGMLNSLADGSADESENKYEEQVNAALDKFLTAYFDCEFVSHNGKRCINKSMGHGEKHQNEWGWPIGIGNWTSDFASAIRDDFLPALRRRWKEILVEMPQIDTCSKRDYIEKLHRKNMLQLFKAVPELEASEPVTCVWCMGNPSHEVFHCGHWICRACIPWVGNRYADDARVTEIKNCELHMAPKSFEPPLRLLLLPEHVGCRILSLDGGGVRGIVELVILAELSKKLGGELPVQRFFDLIGGTSTGGIIALSLALGDREPEEELQTFKRICSKAFKPNGGGILTRHITQFLELTIYDTPALEEQLTSALGACAEKRLFHARTAKRDRDLIVPTKVFVTTVEERRKKGAVLTNYSAPTTPESAHYLTSQNDNPLGQFKVWEAARATSAAPTYFNSFRKQHGWHFRDGALVGNNPFKIALSEHKRLSHSGGASLDLLLSIGTGHTLTTDEDSSDRSLPWQHLQQMLKLFKWTLNSTLSAERAWQEDKGRLDGSGPGRYFRINPLFDRDVPKLDDVKSLVNGKLESTTTDYLATEECRKKIEAIATRLIATCFYFQPAGRGKWKISVGELEITGSIRCRFIERSGTIKAFGRLLKERGNLKFCLKNGTGCQQIYSWPLSAARVDKIVVEGIFDLPINFKVPGAVPTFELLLCKDEGIGGSALSGCPMPIEKI